MSFSIRLWRVRPRLVLHIQLFRRVVDRAIPIVVVAHRAVQHVVLQNAVEGLALGDVDGLACSLNLHPGDNLRRARTHQFAVDLYHAGIAALNRTHLREIADLRHRLLRLYCRPFVQQIDQQPARRARAPELRRSSTLCLACDQREYSEVISLSP